ncbi:MAG: 2'-deoxycytidine 5'-triphosphate deaminase [Terracidiphilus sp.]
MATLHIAKSGAGLFPDDAPEIDGAQEPSASKSGILPAQNIRELIDRGCIEADSAIEDGQIQPASMDLRLGPVAYRVQASFLPGKFSKVEKRIKALQMAEIDLQKPAVLERGCVYIVPLLERLNLPKNISASANPKSTTGRLDIFTRLITDYGAEFEQVRAEYKGPLYAEIVSRTFTIYVTQGTRLNQLRFIRGNPSPSDNKTTDLHKKETLVYLDDDSPARVLIDEGVRMSLSLQGDTNSDTVAYKARKNSLAVDLSKLDYYPVEEFWETVRQPKKKAIILDPGDFYILASKERVRVPVDYAAEMVAFDPSMGEFRIHYAGFFDPGFGYGAGDIRGTRAVLEVRAHEVPFLIEDGQIVCRLLYTHLLSRPDKIYGVGIGSNYQRQALTLSKQFKRPNTAGRLSEG